MPARDILVIEDDPAVADVLHLALRSEGYTVDVAVDGEDGLTSLQQRRYRLLLLPDVTGLLLRVSLWLRRVGLAAPVDQPGVRIHSLGPYTHGLACMYGALLPCSCLLGRLPNLNVAGYLLLPPPPQRAPAGPRPSAWDLCS